MAAQLKLALSEAQQAELLDACLHHPKPYVRERAAALLKLAAGQSARQVARHGLLTVYRAEAVSGWLARYRQDGLGGLLVRSGRGRKPACSPQDGG